MLRITLVVLLAWVLATSGCGDDGTSGAQTPEEPVVSSAAGATRISSEQEEDKKEEKPAPMTETEKIEALIATISALKNAVFIRNGKEYTCAEAVDHMRMKWRWKRREIKTVRDFIRVAASKSSTTGKPYLIRFKDSREVKSGDFFLARLVQLEGGKKDG